MVNASSYATDKIFKIRVSSRSLLHSKRMCIYFVIDRSSLSLSCSSAVVPLISGSTNISISQANNPHAANV